MKFCDVDRYWNEVARNEFEVEVDAKPRFEDLTPFKRHRGTFAAIMVKVIIGTLWGFHLLDFTEYGIILFQNQLLQYLEREEMLQEAENQVCKTLNIEFIGRVVGYDPELIHQFSPPDEFSNYDLRNRPYLALFVQLLVYNFQFLVYSSEVFFQSALAKFNEVVVVILALSWGEGERGETFWQTIETLYLSDSSKWDLDH